MNLKKANDIRDLAIMKEDLGLMTSDEALLLAIDFDEAAKSVGPFDPAFVYFAKQHLNFIRYAELLCNEECSK